MDQSLLIVDDAFAIQQAVTLRDGVRINPATGTAWVEEKSVGGQQRKEGAKFDIELLEAGTVFDLHFEVALTEKKTAEQVLPYLAMALSGFEQGEIRLGACKRRGFGQCRVDKWKVSRFHVADDPKDLFAWLETPPTQHRPDAVAGPIATVLVAPDHTDEREFFEIDATLSLHKSSILIRSGFGEADVGPDAEQLHGMVDGERKPVVAGTSWAGVIRHRALRIAKTLAQGENGDPEQAEELVNDLFGWMPVGRKEGGWGSRLTVDETAIEEGQLLYQTRVRIDRFTGGAYQGALFEQAPVYGKANTSVRFRIHVRNPKPEEIGLLLLILKDLWTERFAGRRRVGGRSRASARDKRQVDAAG